VIRYLVVGNQTLPGRTLLRSLEGMRREGDRFHVVVPLSHRGASWTWTEGGDRALAQARLKEFLETLRAQGYAATGEIGDASPVNAIGDVLRREPGSFDHIILSTLPPGVSRWLGQDVPHRIERAFDVPLTCVVAELTRPYRGQDIPQEGSYDIDNAHSSVEFVARFLGISRIRGRFGAFTGRLHVAEVPEESGVIMTIDAASVDTLDWRRDAHLRSADFLDVNNHPTLEFETTSVHPSDGGHWRVIGDLSIRGVTRPVTLEVDFHGVAVTPSGEPRVGFSASTEIDREDWGLTWNRAVETGGVLVGRRVTIELDIQAVAV
jgi:polyisoprenoid-binding protein YceI